MMFIVNLVDTVDKNKDATEILNVKSIFIFIIEGLTV